MDVKIIDSRTLKALDLQKRGFWHLGIICMFDVDARYFLPLVLASSKSSVEWTMVNRNFFHGWCRESCTIFCHSWELTVCTPQSHRPLNRPAVPTAKSKMETFLYHEKENLLSLGWYLHRCASLLNDKMSLYISFQHWANQVGFPFLQGWNAVLQSWQKEQCLLLVAAHLITCWIWPTARRTLINC